MAVALYNFLDQTPLTLRLWYKKHILVQPKSHAFNVVRWNQSESTMVALTQWAIILSTVWVAIYFRTYLNFCRELLYSLKMTEIQWFMYKKATGDYHDDVTKWKHFPRYWLFVRVIHRSPVNSPHKGQRRGALDVFFDLRLSKQARGRWFETPSRQSWRHYNAIWRNHYGWMQQVQQVSPCKLHSDEEYMHLKVVSILSNMLVLSWVLLISSKIAGHLLLWMPMNHKTSWRHN